MTESQVFNNRKACVTNLEKIEFFSEKIRLTSSDSVVVKIKSSAICGGDKKAYFGDHPFVDFPFALGHEIAGEIVAHGEDVAGLCTGDKVAIEPTVNCGECLNCRVGRYNFCEDLTFLYRRGQAGMARYIEVAADKVYKFDNSLSFQEAALIEPLAVAVHAWQKTTYNFRDRVAIIGCGTIGLLLTQLALNSGIEEVIIIGNNEYKLELARKLGVHLAVNNNQQKEIESLKDNFNKVFEAVGLNETFNVSLDLVRRGGDVILVGLYKDEITVDMNRVIQKEINTLGSQGYCWNFEEAIELVESKRVQLKPLITHQFRLEEIDKAFLTALDSNEKAIKVVCNIN